MEHVAEFITADGQKRALVFPRGDRYLVQTYVKLPSGLVDPQGAWQPATGLQGLADTLEEAKTLARRYLGGQ